MNGAQDVDITWTIWTLRVARLSEIVEFIETKVEWPFFFFGLARCVKMFGFVAVVWYCGLYIVVHESK